MKKSELKTENPEKVLTNKIPDSKFEN